MAQKNLYDVIIIGSGPAGYTAAIYASRGNLKTLLFAGQAPGGQLMITTDVENYPGFKNAITGPKLMEEMREQAKRFDTEIIDENISTVDFSKNPIEISDGVQKYFSKTEWARLIEQKNNLCKEIISCHIVIFGVEAFIDLSWGNYYGFS